MVGRALTSVFWGMCADRYGRKPVILIGTSTVVIFNTLFGFSVNYWMAIITRFLLGFLNGLLGPIKVPLWLGNIFSGAAEYGSVVAQSFPMYPPSRPTIFLCHSGLSSINCKCNFTFSACLS
ncbi:putative major facilitator, sugar transporter, major facilitator superfamily [Helianthus debilis subsp. tardiflorus]